MRVTISHNRPKEEVVRTVERSFNDLFQGAGGLPVQLVQEHKSWQGSTLTFALTAKMGFMSTPIKGTVDVTDGKFSDWFGPFEVHVYRFKR